MSVSVSALIQEMILLGSPTRAKSTARFFKTGKGEYGEGDIFIGVTVPQVRKVVKKYIDLPLAEIEHLLCSKEHEFRLAALLLLVARFSKASPHERAQIHALYLKRIAWVNNWDLVDSSAEYLVGAYLEGRSKKLLTTLARSKNLWERRIAIIATFHDIKRGTYHETFRITQILLIDPHDLIHKAVGWMLREVGKRCGQAVEEGFLRQHYQAMPRTMLRYAIERFNPELRKKYLTATF
jgi:3-methyladenine DNA glycosylase AlkD